MGKLQHGLFSIAKDSWRWLLTGLCFYRLIRSLALIKGVCDFKAAQARGISADNLHQVIPSLWKNHQHQHPAKHRITPEAKEGGRRALSCLYFCRLQREAACCSKVDETKQPSRPLSVLPQSLLLFLPLLQLFLSSAFIHANSGPVYTQLHSSTSHRLFNLINLTGGDKRPD